MVFLHLLLPCSWVLLWSGKDKGCDTQPAQKAAAPQTPWLGRGQIYCSFPEELFS